MSKYKKYYFLTASILCVVMGFIVLKAYYSKDETILSSGSDAVLTDEMFLKKSKSTLKIGSVEGMVNISKFKKIFTLDTNEPVRTNQWFSSVYFSATSETIFAFPLALRFNEYGFSVSMPRINSSSDVIMGTFVPNLDIIFSDKIEVNVLDSSDFSVRVGLFTKGQHKLMGTVVLTHGSPYIFIDINSSASIAVKSHDNDSISNVSENAWLMDMDGRDIKYGLFGNGSVKFIKKSDKELEISRCEKFDKKDTFFTIGVAPKSLDWNNFAENSLDPIEDTKVYFLDNDEQYVNIFDIKTRYNGNAAFWLLPHHSAGLIRHREDIKCYSDVYFETIRGRQELCVANKFHIKNNKTKNIDSKLDVSVLNSNHRRKLIDLVKKDIEVFSGFRATDTYFLGKELLRAAQLYDLAVQLDLQEESNKIKVSLDDEFRTWRNNMKNGSSPSYGKYLTYDSVIGGVVGHKSSFGSELFNDHHFHYGYFVHAAAIAGRHSEDFVKKNEEIINLMTKDYINTDRSDKRFSFLRAFDMYEGHSWASGMAMFNDGNNQESSSEAIHAYYAGYLWGSLIDDIELKTVSAWLYDQEIETALTYWLLAKEYSPLYEKYEHSLISLLWGGKVEFNTWFSNKPEAKLGIQLIPFSAASQYLEAVSDDVVERHIGETTFPAEDIFFDQLLMYSAIKSPEKALEMFNSKQINVDGGNSLSFVYAWIVTRF